jgi:hypothetical protein
MKQPLTYLLVSCVLVITLSLLGASSALAYRYSAAFTLDQARPDPRITPGALNPAVNQANIGETICMRGYSKSVRPAESYTEQLKFVGIRQYGYSDMRLRDFEEDHLISIGLGGSPTAPQNLWPEPHQVSGGWGSYAKDRLEDKLHDLVCHGRVPLAQAQRDIASDWIAAYKRYVGPNPSSGRRHRRVD